MSSGSLSDWTLISCIFFITLPASVVGGFIPRPSGAALVCAAVVGTVGITLQRPEAMLQLVARYTGPSLLIGVALLVAGIREQRAVQE